MRLLAVLGGGLLTEVPRTVHDCPDHEDNLVLDLAAEVGAMLIVSNDTDLLSMSPWRGTPILTAVAFAAKVDAMRRHAHKKRRCGSSDPAASAGVPA